MVVYCDLFASQIAAPTYTTGSLAGFLTFAYASTNTKVFGATSAALSNVAYTSNVPTYSKCTWPAQASGTANNLTPYLVRSIPTLTETILCDPIPISSINAAKFDLKCPKVVLKSMQPGQYRLIFNVTAGPKVYGQVFSVIKPTTTTYFMTTSTGKGAVTLTRSATHYTYSTVVLPTYPSSYIRSTVATTTCTAKTTTTASTTTRPLVTARAFLPGDDGFIEGFDNPKFLDAEQIPGFQEFLSDDKRGDTVCGSQYNKTCLISSNQPCCSEDGECGSSTSHCGIGCQPSYGNCGGYFRIKGHSVPGLDFDKGLGKRAVTIGTPDYIYGYAKPIPSTTVWVSSIKIVTTTVTTVTARVTSTPRASGTTSLNVTAYTAITVTVTVTPGANVTSSEPATSRPSGYQTSMFV